MTNSDTKAAVVERFNRTLKTKIWRYFTAHNTSRYIDVLSDFIHAYNHSYHRAIGTKPADVTPRNSLKVWRRLYGDRFKSKIPRRSLRKGDHVRLSRWKGVFEKGYTQSFTDEIFIVDAAEVKEHVNVYRLKDYDGEPIKGTFYAEELQKIKDDHNRVYRVEKVIGEKGRGVHKLYLVKWLGWPDKFNSWVESRELKDIGP